MSNSAPIKGTAQCYVSVHSKFHEYLSYHSPDKAGHVRKTISHKIHVPIYYEYKLTYA